MKRCTICGETKPYTDFHKQASRRDGFANWCKPCKSKKKRNYYLSNPQPAIERAARYRAANPHKVSEVKKASRLKKLETYKKKARDSYRANRQSRLEYARRYRKENWPEVLARNTRYKRDRLRSDPLFRLEYSVRNRTFVAFRDQGYGKAGKTRQIIGCDWVQLMDHMASQFQDGMTIDNYGEWHVDHIIPLSSAKSEQELLRLCHYTNLQPLWAADNIRKGASMPEAA